MKDFSQFEKRIGYKFRNPDLLKLAFTHRSYLNEQPGEAKGHNERLEFLGDAVLELAVTKHLYHVYPEKQEGELTSLRAALVNYQTVGAAATDLGMNDYLLLSKGEAKDTGRARLVILANTYEALLGALYLDAGYERAERFIAETILPRMKEVLEHELWRDPKSLFQERAQEKTGITPSYRVLKQIGPDHDKKFSVGAFVGSELVSEGEGHSKQEAEQEAAKSGLKKKRWQ